jgi:hypothetical protein
VLPLVDVDDHQVPHIQVHLEERVGDLTLEEHSEAIDGGPHEVVLVDVALVVLEPGVERRGVLVDANARKADGCGRHQCAHLANGVGGGAQLLVLPLRVALVVLRVVSRNRKAAGQKQAGQLEHGYKTITTSPISKSINPPKCNCPSPIYSDCYGINNATLLLISLRCPF